MAEKEISEVIEFIRRRFPQDCNWLNGNCYWFAAILKARFPFLKIFYMPVSGHYVAGALNTYFDWTGKVAPSEPVIPFDTIKKDDREWYSRLIRDCVI